MKKDYIRKNELLNYIISEFNFSNPKKIITIINHINPDYDFNQDDGHLIGTIYELSNYKYTYDGSKHDYYIDDQNIIIGIC